MPTELQYIATRYESGVLVITIRLSKLDEEPIVFALRDEMVAAIRESDSNDVVVEMQNVEYLTSIALLPFVSIRSAAEQRGGRIVLSEPTEIVVEVLSISQLIVESRDTSRHLQMADNLDAAIALLTS